MNSREIPPPSPPIKQICLHLSSEIIRFISVRSICADKWLNYKRNAKQFPSENQISFPYIPGINEMNGKKATHRTIPKLIIIREINVHVYGAMSSRSKAVIYNNDINFLISDNESFNRNDRCGISNFSQKPFPRRNYLPSRWLWLSQNIFNDILYVLQLNKLSMTNMPTFTHPTNYFQFISFTKVFSLNWMTHLNRKKGRLYGYP